MTGARVVITGISAATGACFAAVAGLSISAMAVPVRRFHIFSAVIAAMAIFMAYMAFRAAIASRTNEEIVVASLRRGVIGAIVGLVVIVAYLLLFGPTFDLAHALGRRTSDFTTFRLLIASVLLGFGTGFVIRIPRTAARPGNAS